MRQSRSDGCVNTDTKCTVRVFMTTMNQIFRNHGFASIHVFIYMVPESSILFRTQNRLYRYMSTRVRQYACVHVCQDLMASSVCRTPCVRVSANT